MSLGLLGSYYSSSSEDEDEDCDKTEITRKAEGTDDSNNAPKLANPFQKSASHSLKPSYMVATEDLSAAKQVSLKLLINFKNEIRISRKYTFISMYVCNSTDISETNM